VKLATRKAGAYLVSVSQPGLAELTMAPTYSCLRLLQP
jgi:hypothetical protein